MKSIALTFLSFLVIAPVVLKAQDIVAAAENKNAPVITFDEKHRQNNRLVYDYGSVEKGGDGVCYFVFTNTGKEPLIIEKASSSCGCTVPNPPMYPILPGQKDSISVKYDTKRVGSINKVINVTSNATNSPTALYIAGNVVEIKPAIPENTTGTSLIIKKED
jgi:hypothetical protein